MIFFFFLTKGYVISAQSSKKGVLIKGEMKSTKVQTLGELGMRGIYR